MLDHERLRVYQVAIGFAELALRIIERIPRGAGKLGDQLFRSGTSIPANIAEGGSHLDVVRLLKCVSDEEIDNGKAMLIEIVKMLTVMMRT